MASTHDCGGGSEEREIHTESRRSRWGDLVIDLWVFRHERGEAMGNQVEEEDEEQEE